MRVESLGKASSAEGERRGRCKLILVVYADRPLVAEERAGRAVKLGLKPGNPTASCFQKQRCVGFGTFHKGDCKSHIGFHGVIRQHRRGGGYGGIAISQSSPDHQEAPPSMP